MSTMIDDLSSLGQADGEATPEAAPAPAGPTLEQRLAGVEQMARQQPQLNQMMSDPDFAALVAAKNRGEKVRVISGQQLEEPAEPEKPIDWASLDQNQTAVEMNRQIEKRAREIARAEVGPIAQRQKQIETEFTRQQDAQVAAEITRVQKKYPDFATYQNQMVALNNQVGGRLGPEELYILARQLSGKTPPAEERRQTESERPNTSAARPPERAVAPVAQGGNGRAGFYHSLGKALSKLPT